MTLAINMKKGLSLLLISSVLLLVSCGPMKINQILVNPSRYAGKDVEVESSVVMQGANMRVIEAGDGSCLAFKAFP